MRRTYLSTFMLKVSQSIFINIRALSDTSIHLFGKPVNSEFPSNEFKSKSRRIRWIQLNMIAYKHSPLETSLTAAGFYLPKTKF